MNINYETLRGVDGYLAAFPEQFEPLNPDERKRLARTLHHGVLEGAQPTAERIEQLIPLITGQRRPHTLQEILDNRAPQD